MEKPQIKYKYTICLFYLFHIYNQYSYGQFLSYLLLSLMLNFIKLTMYYQLICCLPSGPAQLLHFSFISKTSLFVLFRVIKLSSLIFSIFPNLFILPYGTKDQRKCLIIQINILLRTFSEHNLNKNRTVHLRYRYLFKLRPSQQ